MTALPRHERTPRHDAVTHLLIGLVLLAAVACLVFAPDAAPLALLALGVLLVAQLVAGIRHRHA